jgi:hypothetical protein
MPILRKWSDGHFTACHRAEELPPAGEVIEPGHIPPMTAQRLALYAKRARKSAQRQADALRLAS